jgi:hypothetical protein
VTFEFMLWRWRRSYLRQGGDLATFRSLFGEQALIETDAEMLTPAGRSSSPLGEPRPVRVLFIIARRDRLMCATLKDSFAKYADIDVILDRRQAQRRRQTLPPKWTAECENGARSTSTPSSGGFGGWSWSREPTRRELGSSVEASSATQPGADPAGVLRRHPPLKSDTARAGQVSR